MAHRVAPVTLMLSLAALASLRLASLALVPAGALGESSSRRREQHTLSLGLKHVYLLVEHHTLRRRLSSLSPKAAIVRQTQEEMVWPIGKHP